MTHEESKIQQDCVKWFRYQYPSKLLFAIPNGGRRGKIEAGVLAGVADLCLAYPNGNRHGLYIEMKTSKGRQSDAQKAFELYVTDAGYGYAVCRSIDEFIMTVNEYLK